MIAHAAPCESPKGTEWIKRSLTATWCFFSTRQHQTELQSCRCQYTNNYSHDLEDIWSKQCHSKSWSYAMAERNEHCCSHHSHCCRRSQRFPCKQTPAPPDTLVFQKHQLCKSALLRRLCLSNNLLSLHITAVVGCMWNHQCPGQKVYRSCSRR